MNLAKSQKKVCLVECQNSKALLRSVFILLATSVFFRLLSVVAGDWWIAVLPCTHFWITDWLQEKKKREAIFYVISSPSGSGESLIYTSLFSMFLMLLWPSLAPSFVLLSFLNFFLLFLLSNTASLLFTNFPSNFYILRNVSCRKTSSLLKASSTITWFLTHWLFCFKNQLPVSIAVVCVLLIGDTDFIVATEGHCSDVV